MHHLTEIVFSSEFWKIALPALAAVGAWILNERSKIAWEQFKRREESYKELLRCLAGFYVLGNDTQLKKDFLHQTNLLWLYAPDHVIRAAYGFLATVHTGANSSDQVKERAVGALVGAIRRDLLSRKVIKRSKLVEEDFRHLAAS
jgi:hypothetical protein